MKTTHNTPPAYSIGHWLTPEQLVMLGRKGSESRPSFQVSVELVTGDSLGLGSRSGLRALVVETAKWHDEKNLEVSGVLVGLVDEALSSAVVNGFLATRSGCLWKVSEESPTD